MHLANFDETVRSEAKRSNRAQNLKRLLHPRSIVVIGASTDPAKAGSQALLSLRTFPGSVIAVHPRAETLHGYRSYPDVPGIPEGIDLAILAIPAASCVDVVEALAQRGVAGVFIVSGGFGESGDAGAELEAKLAEICARTGIRLLGPNTSGFIAPTLPLVASFVPGVDQIEAGRVAVVAQSGGVNLSLAFLLHTLGEGVSVAVGLGNAIDVRSSDVLNLLAKDPDTRSIALHLEGVTDGRHLYETLREVTKEKPVVAIVAGKSDIGDFAASHTGNLLGSRQRTVSALRQAGVVVVDTLEQLAQASVILASVRLPPLERVRVGLVTGQAGPGLLIADELKSRGVELPKLSSETVSQLAELLPPMTYVSNPVDTGRPGPSFPDVTAAVTADPNIDICLVFGLNEPSVLDPATSLVKATAVGKPVVFGTLGTPSDLREPLRNLKEAGLLGVLGPERLVMAAVALAADARGRFLSGVPASNLTRGKPLAGEFDEARAKDLLLTLGIISPRREMCSGTEQAKAAFAKMSKPVVAKIAASDILHKTEVGGVVLNITSEAELDLALAKISSIPTADPGRVLLEEMAGPGVELIIGGVRDPSWGAIVMVGLGGVFTEALADTSLCLAPVTHAQALDMLAELRAQSVLEGFRGLPPVDRHTVANALLAVGALLDQHPDIAEIEINPFSVNGEHALALDALIHLGEPDSSWKNSGSRNEVRK